MGSYQVNQGPLLSSNPPTYSCVEACALLFGGSAANYNCSTNNAAVDHQAWLSVNGDGCVMDSEKFKKNTFYGCHGVGCAESAYVADNCVGGQTNYCFWKPPAAPAMSPVVLVGVTTLLLTVGLRRLRRRTAC